MEEKVFGVLTTVVGLVAGWTLNEASSFIKATRENKRVLNRVLYTQLEIRDIIKKTNLNQVKEEVIETLKNHFAGEDGKKVREFVQSLMDGYVQNELHRKFSPKLKTLTDSYREQIDELSRIDPFATFYISNKDILFDYLNFIRESVSAIELQLSKQLIQDGVSEGQLHDPTIKGAFDRLSAMLTPLLYQEALDTIEQDMIDISKSIGPMKWFKTNRHLNRTKKIKIDNFDVSKINTLLNSLNEAE